jgi:hypothetical protein
MPLRSRLPSWPPWSNPGGILPLEARRHRAPRRRYSSPGDRLKARATAGFGSCPAGKSSRASRLRNALSFARYARSSGSTLSIEGPSQALRARIEGRAFSFIVFPASFLPGESLTLAAHDEWGYFSAKEIEGLELAPLDGPALEAWAGGAGLRRSRGAP